MRLFSNIVFVWAMLFLSQPTIAADAPVEIILSAQVRDMLKNAPPARKQKLQKAILAGNKVITRFLDSSIFIDDEKWPERTGSLLGINALTFLQMTYEWAGGDPSFLVCPNVRLIELLETENGEMAISYQSMGLGLLTSETSKSGSPYAKHYSAVRKGELHQMKLRLNANHKLVNAIPQDQITPTSYKTSISTLKSARVSQLKPNWFRKNMYQDDTPARVQARVASYDQAIKDMDQAASEVCKSTPSNTTITKEQ